MCTALSWNSKDHYFGRNLDLEYGYDEKVVVTPRNYPFHFRRAEVQPQHYAMIGMATMKDGYPLYYEATNEMGLSMAGLNFPGNAVYLSAQTDKTNIAPFEFIPWILGQSANLNEAKSHLQRLNLVNIPFSPELPLSPLHWLIADRQGAIVAEPMADGLRIYENPVGVLTNNPPLEFHLQNLGQYLNITSAQAENRFSSRFNLTPWSNGMGGLGLPGDYSSASRFVKATFVKLNSPTGQEQEESVSQFFHILSSVEMPLGAVKMSDGRFEITRYSCCCNASRGIYYYKTYNSSRIVGIDLHQENLDGSAPIAYPLIDKEHFLFQNEQP